MNRAVSHLIAILLGLSPAVTLASMPSVPGEVLVKFRSGVSTASANYSIFRQGGFRVKRLGSSGFEQVQLPDGKNVDIAIQEFLADPNIETAQPNYIYKTLATVPNDTHYGKLWGLKNTGQTVNNTGLGGLDTHRTPNTGTSGSDMNLEAAWDLITDCSSVVVAVVDTGVNFTQEDLVDNIWDGNVGSYPNGGYDFVSSSNAMSDPNGHGTHVAGTIGATGNNAKGATGVCWNVKIMGVRVMDATGSGTTSRIVQGVNFGVTNGAKVINLSVGGSGYDSAFSTAITNARSNGVVIVAAAGNDGANNDASGTPTYPCNYTQDNVICVAALTQSYGLASFSNYGSTSVDVGAPGVNIASTWPGTNVETAENTSGWTGWTLAGSWAYNNAFTNIKGISNPSSYDSTSATYANSADDIAYKSFNISGAQVATLEFGLVMDLASGDGFSVACKNDGTSPFTGGTTVQSAVTGSTDGYIETLTYEITSCASATTSVGYRLTSNASGVDFGLLVGSMSINTLTYDTTTYNLISGTSMATPQVAGLAAMLFAYNPTFTYTDVVNAIKNSGDTVSALSGKSTTSKGVDAYKALLYINPPSSVTAVSP